MDFETTLKLLNQVGPYAPRISKAIATIKRVLSDPDVKDAIALVKELGGIVEPLINPPNK